MLNELIKNGSDSVQSTIESRNILLNNIGEIQSKLGLLDQASESFLNAANGIRDIRVKLEQPISRDEWLNSLNYLRANLKIASLGSLTAENRIRVLEYATRLVEELEASARHGSTKDELPLAKLLAMRAALSMSGPGDLNVVSGQSDLIRVLELSENVGHKDASVLTAALNYLESTKELPSPSQALSVSMVAARDSVFAEEGSTGLLWKYLFARGFGKEAIDAVNGFVRNGGSLNSAVDRATVAEIVGGLVSLDVESGKLDSAAQMVDEYQTLKVTESANRLFKSDSSKKKLPSVQKIMLDWSYGNESKFLEKGEIYVSIYTLKSGQLLIRSASREGNRVVLVPKPQAKGLKAIYSSLSASDVFSKSIAGATSVYLNISGGLTSDLISESLNLIAIDDKDQAPPSPFTSRTLSHVPCSALIQLAKKNARLPKGSIGIVGSVYFASDTSVIEKANSSRFVTKYEISGLQSSQVIQAASGASDIVHVVDPFHFFGIEGRHGELFPVNRSKQSGQASSVPASIKELRQSSPIWQIANLPGGQATVLSLNASVSEAPNDSMQFGDDSTTAALLASLEAGYASLVLGNRLAAEGEPVDKSVDWKLFYSSLGVKPIGSAGMESGLLVMGHPGFSRETEMEYAKGNLDRYVEAGDDLLDEENWSAAAVKYKEALYLARVSANDIAIGDVLKKLVGVQYQLLSYDVALRFQEEIAERSLRQKKLQEMGDAYLDTAVLAVRAGELAKSDAALEVAEKYLSETGSTAAVAKVWHYRGISSEARRDYDKTIQFYMKSRELYSKAGMPKLATQRLVDAGTVYKEKLSNFPLALEYYDSARAEFERDNDIDALLNLQIDRANTLMASGDIKWAIGVLEKHVLSKIVKAEQPAIWIRASQILANAYYRAGMFQDSVDQNKKTTLALTLIASERLRAALEIDALNLDAMLKAKLQGYNAALVVFQQSVDLAVLHGFKDKEAIAYNNIGFWSREYGDVDKSIRHFNQALAIDKDLKSKSDIAFDQRNLGLSVILTGDYSQASALLRESLAASDELGLSYNSAYSRFGLGDIALREKKWQVAIDEFEAALKTAEKSYLQDFVWRAHAAIARGKFELGDFAAAEISLAKALDQVEKLRAGLKSESSRTGFQSERGVQDVYGDYVKVLMKLGRSEEAWVVAERSRARAFIDSMGNQRLKFAHADSEKFLDTDRRIASEIELAERKAAIAGSSNAESNLEIEKLRKSSVLNFQKLKSADPQLAQFARVEAITLEEFSGVLKNDTGVLEYMVTDTQIFIWFIKGRSIKSFTVNHELGKTTKAIEDYRSLLQSFSSMDYQGKILSDLLFAPVANELSGLGRLTIIPHGPLHFLSFASLRVNGKYLLELFPLSYLESATFARYLRPDTKRSNQSIKILAMGNPDRGAELDLPFAEKEATSIKRFFNDAEVYVGKSATEAIYRKFAGNSDVIHIAAHGEFNSNSPSESKLLLANDGVGGGDLKLADIFSYPLKARLVALSACETGLGRVSIGDEVIGMNRAFFYAGAESIISSLWRISDVASAVIMKRFYRSLAAGQSKDEALRGAQLFARNYYSHPAYWTAFRLVGDSR